jgi:hypothetical protein
MTDSTPTRGPFRHAPNEPMTFQTASASYGAVAVKPALGPRVKSDAA